MNPLIKCPRCEKYTNPLPTEKVLNDGSLALWNACEYCGWKIRVSA